MGLSFRSKTEHNSAYEIDLKTFGGTSIAYYNFIYRFGLKNCPETPVTYYIFAYESDLKNCPEASIASYFDFYLNFLKSESAGECGAGGSTQVDPRLSATGKTQAGRLQAKPRSRRR